VKPVPFTVNVVAVAPALTLFGDIDVIDNDGLGVTGLSVSAPFLLVEQPVIRNAKEQRVARRTIFHRRIGRLIVPNFMSRGHLIPFDSAISGVCDRDEMKTLEQDDVAIGPRLCDVSGKPNG
jgi:hypothetical protein